MSNQMSIANKVANVAFAGKTFKDRTRVYKKRVREMKKLMMEAYERGGKCEAYPYAMRILMIKKDIEILLETAKRINFLYQFTLQSMTNGKKLADNFVAILNKCSHVALYKGLIELRQQLTIFEETFDVADDELTAKYKKLTRKNAYAVLNAALNETNKENKDS